MDPDHFTSQATLFGKSLKIASAAASAAVSPVPDLKSPASAPMHHNRHDELFARSATQLGSVGLGAHSRNRSPMFMRAKTITASANAISRAEQRELILGTVIANISQRRGTRSRSRLDLSMHASSLSGARFRGWSSKADVRPSAKRKVASEGGHSKWSVVGKRFTTTLRPSVKREVQQESKPVIHDPAQSRGSSTISPPGIRPEGGANLELPGPASEITVIPEDKMGTGDRPSVPIVAMVDRPSFLPDDPSLPTFKGIDSADDSNIPSPFVDSLMGVMYPGSLGIDEGLGHLCMKAGMALLASGSTAWITWTSLGVWGLTSLATLWWLRVVFRRYETTSALPIEYGTVNVINVCSGLIFYQESKHMDTWQLGLVCAGVCVILLGIQIGRLDARFLEEEEEEDGMFGEWQGEEYCTNDETPGPAQAKRDVSIPEGIAKSVTLGSGRLLKQPGTRPSVDERDPENTRDTMRENPRTQNGQDANGTDSSQRVEMFARGMEQEKVLDV